MTYDPTWKTYEKDMHSSNVQTARQATDAFLDEREKEIKTSAKARDWEEDRKKSWAKDKPVWRKEQIEKDPIEHMKKTLKEGGSYMRMLHPAPGYLLVELPEKNSTTDSGIILPDDISFQQEGVAVQVGDSKIEFGASISCPCRQGDTIFFKKGAGLEIKLNEKTYYFMMFSDVLGVFE